MTDAPDGSSRRLRIAIDARLNAYRIGGIPQYTAQLVRALAELAPADELVVLEHRRARRPLASAPNICRRRLWTPPHNRWEQWSLPLELRDLRADLLHCPDFIPPLRRRIPAVVTVHDLAFLRFPEILDDDAKRYYGRIGAAVRSAEAIIAVSEATRRDLAELLDVALERVDVASEAAAAFFTPLDIRAGEQREINGARLVAGAFALFVGTIEPRKNLPTLLNALARCRAGREAAPRLVVAGARGWLDGPVFALIRDLQLGDRLQLIGGVGEEDLRWLYNACRFYVQPELYSGFGLTVLEAMQCGAPVLASDSGAIPELARDAALLLRATDVEQWTEGLLRLWNDDELRADLRARGFARAAGYTWERAARETRAVYARVAG